MSVCEATVLTSGIILIDWHKINNKEIQTRMVPRLASRCCLSVISSLFLKKFLEILEEFLDNPGLGDA